MLRNYISWVLFKDTLKATPPENVVMKRANTIAVATTTAFYMMCGCFGYAALGNHAPGNMLTGFYEPFWLVNVANACVVAHLVGAYQVSKDLLLLFLKHLYAWRIHDFLFVSASCTIKN